MDYRWCWTTLVKWHCGGLCTIDRLARNNVDLQTLVKDINAKGVTIQFLKEGLTFGHDTESNPISKMMLTMLAAISEFERELIRERQREELQLPKRMVSTRGVSPSSMPIKLKQWRSALLTVNRKPVLLSRLVLPEPPCTNTWSRRNLYRKHLKHDNIAED